MARKKVLFQQGNAPAHKSAIAIAKLVELRFEVLPHAPYIPDLAPSDFFLFPKQALILTKTLILTLTPKQTHILEHLIQLTKVMELRNWNIAGVNVSS